MRLSLLGLTLLLPSLPIAAQEYLNHAIPHPDGLVTGNASEVLIGCFNGDVIPDAMVLQDGDLLLIDSPDRISYFTKVEGSYTSICKVNLGTSQDGVLAASSAGLTLFQWSGGALAASSVTAPADWASATRLQTVLSPSWSAKICGVSASGTKILAATWSGSALSSSAVNDLQVPILALAGLHWDGDGVLDFAYDLGAGVVVLSQAGSYSSSQTCGTPQLLRLPIPGYDDGVLWLTSNPSGGQRLLSLARVIGSQGIAVMQEFLCAPNTVERMTLASFDTGGGTDLVLSIANTEGRFFRVLYRYGPAHFWIFGDTGESAGVQLGLDDVSGTCTPAPPVASGDMDGDGDDDLLFAGHAGCTAMAQVFFPNGTAEERQDPEVRDHHVKPWLFYSTTVEKKPTYNRFRIYPWEKPTVGPAAGATHVRVRVFEGSEYVVSHSPMADASFSFEDLETEAIVLTFPPYLPDTMYFEFSYETRSGSTVTKAFPAWVGTFTEQGFPYEDIGGKSTGGFDRPPRPPSGP
jgi:hypothetical protein